MQRLNKEYCNKSSLELVKILAQEAIDKKAENIIMLDVAKLSGYTDYFLIVSGRSSRHVQGIAASLDKLIGSKRLKSASTEGFEEGHWVLLDFNDVVVHVFYHEVRNHFDIEGLWHEAPRVEL